MPSFTFSDLETVTDEVHALFDGWDTDGTMERSLDPTGALVLRLAVHEWIANLVQHAYFRRDPRIQMEVSFETGGVAVALEDTSEGFDFAQQLGTQRAILNSPAPSERGRGLLMLITCADEIGFQPATQGQSQRIAFAIRPPHEDVSFAALFRQDDLTPDPDFLGDESSMFGTPDASFGDADPSLGMPDGSLGDGAAEPVDAPPSTPDR